MSYLAAIESLYALGHELAPASIGAAGALAGNAPSSARRKFDLEQMRALTEALGHP